MSDPSPPPDRPPPDDTPAEAPSPEQALPTDPSLLGVRPVDLRDYVSFSQDAARRVRVFGTGQLALDLWCIEPQQATPVLHYEEQEVTYTVIGGRSWFVTDAGEVGLDPMGAMVVAPGVVHGIDNRAADPLIVVAVSSPPSDDPEDVPVEPTAAAIRHERDRPNRLRRVAERVLGTGRAEHAGG